MGMDENISYKMTEEKGFFDKYKNILLFLLFFAVAILAFKVFYGKPDNKTFSDDAKWKNAIDSMKRLDSARVQYDKYLSTKIKDDSVSAATNYEALRKLQNDIEDYKTTVNNINKKYDDKKRVIDNMPTSQRLGFFSSWLTAEDSLSKTGSDR